MNLRVVKGHVTVSQCQIDTKQYQIKIYIQRISLVERLY